MSQFGSRISGFFSSGGGGSTPITIPLPITDGGTGSSTKNFVDLSNTQTIGGSKTFSSSPILSSLSASQILATNGSSVVQALDTTTYPSLTELSYVKGATSGIQGQLNAKQPLSNSAYSFPANNTSGSANMTANTFNDKGQQVYSGAIFWTGATPPSGAISHTYSWTQVGKMVSLRVNLVYAVAGSALTQVAIALPSDCPNPIEPTGLGSANEIIMSAYGYLLLTSTTQNSAFQRAYLRVNSTDTGYELLIAGGGANYKLAYITINYWTS